MVDAGRILIMPKGIWSNLVSYEMLDVVTQDNIAYLARQSSVGVSPKNDSSYTYWQPFGTSVTPDGETIIMDSTDNLAVNLDNKSLIYNGNLAVNIDNKSLKCENNLAVNIDNKSLVYDDTNMYVKVAIDGSTIKYDSVHGYLYVDASNFNINDLNNIAITSPADGQTLVYDSATQKWKNGQGQSSISSVISDAWNASTTYAVGKYCIYNNLLWKCLVQHSGQTPTEGTYWTKVTVANEITSVNNSFVSNIYVGNDGKLHKVQGGADSVLPFSSNKRYSYSWTSSNNEQKTLTLEIEPKYIAFTVGGIKSNAVLYDVENQEYIINAPGANIITSVNGKVVTINTYHGSTAVNYLNYW